MVTGSAVLGASSAGRAARQPVSQLLSPTPGAGVYSHRSQDLLLNKALAACEVLITAWLSLRAARLLSGPNVFTLGGQVPAVSRGQRVSPVGPVRGFSQVSSRLGPGKIVEKCKLWKDVNLMLLGETYGISNC